jgi:hypothetical protein
MVINAPLKMAILNCRCAETGVGAESVTSTVKVDWPVAEGVPEITPELLSDRFAGSDPAVMLQVSVPVPPAAASAAL